MSLSMLLQAMLLVEVYTPEGGRIVQIKHGALIISHHPGKHWVLRQVLEGIALPRDSGT